MKKKFIKGLFVIETRESNMIKCKIIYFNLLSYGSVKTKDGCFS